MSRRVLTALVLMAVFAVSAPAPTRVATAGPAAAPTVSAVSPTTGALKGGARVTISGSGFVGVRAVRFGTAKAGSVRVRSSTVMEVTSPPRPAGAVVVQVTTAGGTSSATPGARYVYISPPLVTGLAPASGDLAGGTPVTVTGARFVGVTAVRFGPVAATSWTVTSSTTLTVTAPPGASPGAVPVTVFTNSGSARGPEFTYAASLPVIDRIDPNTGQTSGGGSVTIGGSRFAGATSVTFADAPASFTVLDDATVTAVVPAGPAGPAPVVVTTPVGRSAPAAFTYVAAPVIAAVTPASGTADGGADVEITGTGLAQVRSVTFGGADATAILEMSDGRLRVTTPTHDAGEVDVVVTTAYGASEPATYRYVTPAPAAQQIVTGSHHSCRLSIDGAVTCWGWNGHGQLGDGTTLSRERPVAVTGLESGVRRIAAGGATTCAIKDDDAVVCWGWNAFGQLGTGDRTDRMHPVAVGAIGGSGAETLSVGNGHTCAASTSGEVRCWGWNHYGQLGDGTRTDRLLPVPVTGLSAPVVEVTAGDEHTCARSAVGNVWCWGAGHLGQLGDGTRQGRATPGPVTGLPAAVTGISAGVMFTCAREAAQSWCWGRNAHGQLGDGTHQDRPDPVRVSGLPVAASHLSAGGHSCAVADGRAYCWGQSPGAGPVPSLVTGVAGLRSVSAGDQHACGVTTDGTGFCWGEGGQGQLGDGTRIDRPAAVPVLP